MRKTNKGYPCFYLYRENWYWIAQKIISNVYKWIDNMAKLKIPGVTFSWKRALGISKIKQQIARETGIPTTKHGLERKIGGAILKLLKGK